MIELTVGPNEKDNKKFAELLFNLRSATSNHISRVGVARQLLVTSEYMRLIERGDRVPTFGLFKQMLNLYDIEYTSEPGLVCFENCKVRFTSRVQEARHKPDLPVDREKSRNEKIGEIVRLVASADDETLNIILKKLERLAR